MNRLRCDFHIHTTYSDGICSVQEIVQLYAKEQFDVIAITDHALDSFTAHLFSEQGRWAGVGKENFPDYLHELEKMRQQAVKHNLHLIKGIEVSNNTKEYHVLALDVKEWIDPDLSVPEIVAEIHRQEGVAVACHPAAKLDEQIQGAFRHLYENRETYRHLFDAWEIANRYHLFPTVGLMQVPYLANSDLHRPEHIYSWKTSLIAEKFNTPSIKSAICNNDTVSIFLHRKS
jgi:hypothetical protein